MTKLEQMLKYVSEHNDFYKKRIKEYGITNPLDITQWPILTRKELQENRYNMFSDGYKTKYYNEQLLRQSSSGSFGIPINVYWDYNDWYASNLCLWRRRREWYGIKPSDKKVVFTLHAYGKEYNGQSIFYQEIRNTLYINMSLVQNDHQIECVVKQIIDFSPTWIYIQPSILEKILRFDYQLSSHFFEKLSYIESVGELFTCELRRKAQDVFKVPIANLYGSEEMNGIAYESPMGVMSILDDNVFLEINSDDIAKSTDRGEAIVTNLHNKAMPLIRYCQEDIISIKHSSEGPNNLVNVFGRVFDTIHIYDYEINGILLAEIISETNNVFYDSIIEYSYVYDENSKSLTCNIVLQTEFNNWKEYIKKHIKDLFAQKVYPNQYLFFNVEIQSLKPFSCKSKRTILTKK